MAINLTKAAGIFRGNNRHFAVSCNPTDTVVSFSTDAMTAQHAFTLVAQLTMAGADIDFSLVDAKRLSFKLESTT